MAAYDRGHRIATTALSQSPGWNYMLSPHTTSRTLTATHQSLVTPFLQGPPFWSSSLLHG